MHRNIYSATALASVILIIFSCAPARKLPEEIPVKKPTTAVKPVVVSSEPVATKPLSQPSRTALNTNGSVLTSFGAVFPATIKSVLDKAAENSVQIIYTEINRDKNNEPHFTPHYFNVEQQNFFPAGTAAELPLALMSLQKAAALKMEGVSLYTTMITESAGSNLPGTYNDPNTENGKPSLFFYLQRLLLANDTSAFNRLYEFLGQEYIANAFTANGFAGNEIVARVGEKLSPWENAITNPVVFYNESGRILYKKIMAANTSKIQNGGMYTAGDYFENGKSGLRKIDLANTNKVSLPAMDDMMKRLFFPAAQTSGMFFNLLPADRTFMQAWLGLLPRQNKFPTYNDLPDAFDKYLYYGADNGRKDPRFRVYNVSGKEYGQMTDVAYIVDLDRKVEFLLSATIYCGEKNAAGAISYNYNNIGLPFFRDLGIAVYRYELMRKKNYLPDFSRLPLSE